MISPDEIASNYKVVVFDYDDTLVSEKEFLFFTYRQIAALVYRSHKIPENEVFEYLKNEFELHGRDLLFNKLIRKYNLPITMLSDLLGLMRTAVISPALTLLPGMKSLLKRILEKDVKVYVLTNGNHLQQINKIRHTQWEGLEKRISFVFADLHEPKPSPVCLQLIQKQTNTDCRDMVFIGDSEIDYQCALNAKVPFLYSRQIQV
jgi:phosphoglycolate phosphatase-like HAD superfamily hydrolase